MEVIILVTDIHRTRSWINVAFQGSEVAARASSRLGLKKTPVVTVSPSTVDSHVSAIRGGVDLGS